MINNHDVLSMFLSSSCLSEIRWDQDIQTDHSEYNHHQVDKILTDPSSVFLPTKCGQNKKQGHPNKKLISHEHSCTTQ